MQVAVLKFGNIRVHLEKYYLVKVLRCMKENVPKRSEWTVFDGIWINIIKSHIGEYPTEWTSTKARISL